MAWKAMYGAAPAADLKADYRAAAKFGTFRIGKEALYFPAFPTGASYIPLSALDSAWVRKSLMSPKGCCGGQFPVYVLHVSYGGGLYQNLTLEKEQEARRALGLLREGRPDLPGMPDEAASSGGLL